MVNKQHLQAHTGEPHLHRCLGLGPAHPATPCSWPHVKSRAAPSPVYAGGCPAGWRAVVPTSSQARPCVAGAVGGPWEPLQRRRREGK